MPGRQGLLFLRELLGSEQIFGNFDEAVLLGCCLDAIPGEILIVEQNAVDTAGLRKAVGGDVAASPRGRGTPGYPCQVRKLARWTNCNKPT